MEEVKAQSKSQTIILDGAKKLFWKFGIQKVTVEEICKECGLSKMTFYRHFKNKDQVAQKLMTDLVTYSLDRYRRIMNSEKGFDDKVRELIQIKYESIHEMSNEFIKDVYQYKDGYLAEILNSYRQEMYTEIRKDFTDAQNNGWIRKDVKVDYIMYMLNDMNNKIQDPLLGAIYNDEHKLIMEMTNFFFYGILSK